MSSTHLILSSPPPVLRQLASIHLVMPQLPLHHASYPKLSTTRTTLSLTPHKRIPREERTPTRKVKITVKAKISSTDRVARVDMWEQGREGLEDLGSRTSAYQSGSEELNNKSSAKQSGSEELNNNNQHKAR